MHETIPRYHFHKINCQNRPLNVLLAILTSPTFMIRFKSKIRPRARASRVRAAVFFGIVELILQEQILRDTGPLKRGMISIRNRPSARMGEQGCIRMLSR